MNSSPIKISSAETSAHFENVRILFLEYAASLDIDLSFQGFHAEHATLPGQICATVRSALCGSHVR
jgi:hypothetical protein